MRQRWRRGKSRALQKGIGLGKPLVAVSELALHCMLAILLPRDRQFAQQTPDRQVALIGPQIAGFLVADHLLQRKIPAQFA